VWFYFHLTLAIYCFLELNIIVIHVAFKPVFNQKIQLKIIKNIKKYDIKNKFKMQNKTFYLLIFCVKKAIFISKL